MGPILEESEPNVSKLRAVLRRRWPILVVSTMVGIVAGVVTAQFATSEVEQVFTAAQTVVANPNSGAGALIPQDELKVTRGDIPVRAAELFNESQGTAVEPADLAGTIDTSYDADSSSITISSNDLDADLASARVQAFTTAFLEVTQTDSQSDSRRQLQQIEDEISSLEASLAEFDRVNPQFTQPGSIVGNDLVTQALSSQRSDLLGRLSSLEAEQRNRELELTRTAPYESLGPEKPYPAASGLVSVPTSGPVRAGILGLAGFLLGAVVAMLIERVNRRIDTRAELAEVTSLPILADIGFVKEKQRSRNDDGSLVLDGVWAEPYRRVRSAIQYLQDQAAAPSAQAVGTNGEPLERSGDELPPQVFLVTSTSPGEGKSTTVTLIAQALAEVGTPTLIIGGDFRLPQVDRMLGVHRSPSLADLARMDPDHPTVDAVVQRTRFPDLYAAVAGPGTRETRRLIDAAKEVATVARSRGATVVFDSSPIRASNDTIDLLPVVDYVILVVRAGRSTEAGLREIIETIERMDTKIMGLVLVGTPSAGREHMYYYDYYTTKGADPSGQPTGMGFTAPPGTSTQPVGQSNPGR